MRLQSRVEDSLDCSDIKSHNSNSSRVLTSMNPTLRLSTLHGRDHFLSKDAHIARVSLTLYF